MANVPQRGDARQPRPKHRPRPIALWLGWMHAIAGYVDTVLAPAGERPPWFLAFDSRREACTYLRCWDAAAVKGDSTALRRFLGRRLVAPTATTRSSVETQSELRDHQGRIVASARTWRPSPEEVPPPVNLPRPDTYGHAFGSFTSPRGHLLWITAALLDVLERRGELWRMRALHRCARCAAVFVQNDRRRERGPRIVCDRCRPDEQRDRARHRKAQA
jgi:hypothetical protein